MGHVKFSQDNRSFSEFKRSIQLKSKTERDGQKDAKKKKKRVTDKQSTNKQKVQRSDGVTVLRLLPRWHHPATTNNLMLLYFRCTIMRNYARESAVYPSQMFTQTISERSCTACTA